MNKAADAAHRGSGGSLDLHPWNRAFTWNVPTAPFRFVTEEQAAQFDRDGYVVLDRVFDASVIASVLAEVDRLEAETDAQLRAAHDGRVAISEVGAITFSAHLVTRSSVLRDFSLRPEFAGICADLVGPDVNLYWDQAVYKKPEKPRRFPWHQDNGYAYVEPQQYLTCWVALTDANLRNGCPQVATGLHRMGTLRHRFVDPLGWECFTDPPDVAVAEVGAGGVVVLSSLTPHLTGPNTTDGIRKAYILQYAPAGAIKMEGRPGAGPPEGGSSTDDPLRQYPVVRGGEAVTR